MENATKALIMAGAILIVILIISVGIMVFKSTKGVTEAGKEAGDLMAIETYNNQFTKYCGNRVKGSEVTNLINFVATYKARNNGEGPIVTGVDGNVNPYKDYTVSVPEEGGRDAEGKVITINIELNS